MTEDVARRMTKARTALLLDHPWFGSLALKLRLEARPGLGTMATDGTYLVYDPAFVETLSPAELQGCIAHEVLHCALLHPFRLQSRNKVKFNIAADLAINPMIRESGMQLPAGCLDDPQYHGMPAEQIYALLPDPKNSGGQPDPNQPPAGWGIGQDLQEPPKPQPGKQPGTDQDPDGTGDDETPGTGEVPPMTKEDWEIAVEQQTIIAQKSGKAPAGVVRMVQKARESRTDWRTLLHRFVEQVLPSDYSWSHPNRRHIADGLYMPGMMKENFPKIGVGVDTSGSIGDRELAICQEELDRILRELRPESIEVVYCDSEIPKGGVESFDPDGPSIRLHPKGGGGTAFQPVFDHFAKNGEPPACVIYFTDLYGPEPKDPGYPVLWVTSERSQRLAWFGELVRVELD